MEQLRLSRAHAPHSPHCRGDEYYDLWPLRARQIVIVIINFNIQLDSSKMDTHTESYDAFLLLYIQYFNCIEVPSKLDVLRLDQ